MIRNSQTIFQIQNEWDSIDILQKKMDPFPLIVGGNIFLQGGAPPASYNLLVVLAFSSLDVFLGQCIQEKIFNCPTKKSRAPMLGAKMEASRKVLRWDDYDEIFRGKEARNALAHESILINKDDCLKFVEAIKLQFVAWDLI